MKSFELKSFSILIVDDNYSNILLIRMLLEKYDVTKIYEAKSAVEAFNILEEHPVDAILLDVMMPEIDGITACKTIRDNKKFDFVPIIMITANDDNITLSKSFDAGADDFTGKPINETVLVTRLQSQLQRTQLQKGVVQKSRFYAMDEMISMLAHQWRQPLSLINSVSNTLRTKIMLDNLKPDEVTEGLKSIETYVSELSELITSFKGNFTSSAKECSVLDTIFREAIENESIQTLLENSWVTIHIEPSTLRVNIQKRTLIQIVINMLCNAIEALIRDNITNHPLVTLSIEETNNSFSICIADNANGISAEVLPYIYEPYFSTKLAKNGVGLGLFFVKAQVDNDMKGQITFQRDENKSLFTLLFEKNIC